MKPTSKEVIDELSKILDATPKEIKGFMTPKEKAKELVVKYYEEFIKDYQVLACMPDEIRTSIYRQREKFAKKCALITVDEIIKSRSDDKGFDDTMFANNGYHTPHPLYLSYWKEVKQEIEKI